MMRKILGAALALSILAGQAFAQTPQLLPGEVIGNDTAAQRPAKGGTMTALMDRAFGAPSVQGSILNRGVASWSATRTPVLGLAGSAVGSLGFENATSGRATLSPVAGALGSVTIGIPAASGTMAVGASSPLVLNATTGALTCATCVTSSGGGAITGTAPIVVSGAGVVSITGAALTKVDDTNVTLTLGGTPASALIAATSITVGWTGQLGLTRGGTAASLTASNGGVVFSGASALSILSGTATARLPLLSGASAVGVWGAYTLPSSVTSGGVACFTSTSAEASSSLLTANALVLGGGAGVCPGPMASLGTTTTLLHGNAGGAPTFGQVVYADIASAAIASASNYFSGASSVLVPADQIYQAEVTITYGATTTIDFNTLINGVVTLTGNITTQTLSNVKAGKAGTITFIQDGTGSRTSVWNSVFKFASGATPSLSTTASAVDVLSYSCRSATFCVAALSKDVR